MEGYIAEIRMFAGNFPPRSWAFCQGQILSIAQNTALFALIGVTFGGNGTTTFGLPDLRGRVPIGPGQGPGLPAYNLGTVGGVAANTLNVLTLPSHTHLMSGSVAFPVSGEDGRKTNPANNFPAVNGDNIYSTVSDGSSMPVATNNLALNNAGTASPLPVDNMKPYVALNYIICVEGIFPSRN